MGSVLLGIYYPGNCLPGTSERGEECGKVPVFQGTVSRVPLIPGKSSPGNEFLGSVCRRDIEAGTCNPWIYVGETSKDILQCVLSFLTKEAKWDAFCFELISNSISSIWVN